MESRTILFFYFFRDDFLLIMMESDRFGTTRLDKWDSAAMYTARGLGGYSAFRARLQRNTVEIWFYFGVPCLDPSTDDRQEKEHRAPPIRKRAPSSSRTLSEYEGKNLTLARQFFFFFFRSGGIPVLTRTSSLDQTPCETFTSYSYLYFDWFRTHRPFSPGNRFVFGYVPTSYAVKRDLLHDFSLDSFH